MKIEVLYFGRPRQYLQLSRETAELPPEVATLASLLAWLRLRGETWAHELAENRVRCALNQKFSALTAPIKEQDEIAIFSPVSGG